MARKGGNPDITKVRKPFTTETSRKALKKRQEKMDAKKKLEGQLEAVVDLVTTPCNEAEFRMAIQELPTPMQRIYGRALTGDHPEDALEEIMNRVIGRPKQAVETKAEIKTDEGFQLVVSPAASKVVKQK